jgi:hypothetical protein
MDIKRYVVMKFPEKEKLFSPGPDRQRAERRTESWLFLGYDLEVPTSSLPPL